MQALLSDVDRSMRGAFGDDQGLIVDTAPACGMKVTLRVPKFRRGVRV